MRLRLKFHLLTKAQQKQVRDFYKNSTEPVVRQLNQMKFVVNASNGLVMFFKDF